MLTVSIYLFHSKYKTCYWLKKHKWIKLAVRYSLPRPVPPASRSFFISLNTRLVLIPEGDLAGVGVGLATPTQNSVNPSLPGHRLQLGREDAFLGRNHLCNWGPGIATIVEPRVVKWIYPLCSITCTWGRGWWRWPEFKLPFACRVFFFSSFTSFWCSSTFSRIFKMLEGHFFQVRNRRQEQI